MKNIILIAIIILTFFISCRKSTLEVIPPNFFSKMKDGNYGGFEVKNGGNTVKFNSKDYTFESDIMGIVGIYQDKSNSSNYIGVFPFGDTMHTVSMNKNEKDALTKIIDVVGKEDSLKVIEGLSKVDGGKLDTEAITKNLDEKKKAEVEDIIKHYNLDKNKFGDYKKYEKKT